MGNIPDEKIDRAAIEMKLEIPQDKVDNEAAALRSELLYGLQYQRLTSGNPYVDQDDLRRRLEDIPREALRQVKTQMVLERIAQDQGLTVTRQELEQETCAISQRQNIPMERILDFLGEDLEPIRRDLLLRKAEEWILKN